ncbi:expressed unknown protein [Seminavis robusta]|uniref:Uncharacterized protein n=1 Tax=Seminavis robusta TaxID=568900 RepID=A0A9N8HQU4_9STRA|nr:expressed unknown protein [Seminavis robusta]|eukprot:Sro1486_g276670.1 n/a (277) ;mRNA; r:22738-23568
MSNTKIRQGLSPSNGRKQEGERLKQRTPASNRRNGNGAFSSAQASRGHLGTPQEQRIQGEKWISSPPQKEEEDENMDHQMRPQRTPLSMAIAMKAATSPALSSFPDSFWTPFLEQEEYNRQKLYGSTAAVNSPTPRKLQFHDENNNKPRRKQVKPKNGAAPKKPKSSFGIVTIFRAILNQLVYLATVSFVTSLMYVPYLRPIFEVMAFLGRLLLGFALGVFVFVTTIAWPFLQEQYHQCHLDDTMADIKDWLLEKNLIECSGLDEQDCTLGSFFGV